VQIDKETVTAALRERGFHDRAAQAECALPRSVDTERDAALLKELDVDRGVLETGAGGQPAEDSR
jgi:hypothetical protein